MIEILIGVIAGTFGISGFLYQTWKNPDGMTYPMIGFVFTGITLWTTYGISTNNPIVYAPNMIMMVLLGTTAVRKVKF